MSEPSAAEVADVLDRAHDELLVRGWAQGDYQRDDGSVCLLGAIGYACGRLPLTLPSGKVLTGGLDPLPNYVGRLAVDAIITVADYPVPDWNDEPERTFDEVLDAFRKASKALREEAGAA